MTPNEPPRPVTIRTIRGRYNAFAIERGLVHLSQRDQGIAISCFYAGVRAAFEACKEAGELPDEARLSTPKCQRSRRWSTPACRPARRSSAPTAGSWTGPES